MKKYFSSILVVSFLMPLFSFSEPPSEIIERKIVPFGQQENTISSTSEKLQDINIISEELSYRIENDEGQKFNLCFAEDGEIKAVFNMTLETFILRYDRIEDTYYIIVNKKTK